MYNPTDTQTRGYLLMSDTSLDVQAHRHTDKRLAKDTRHLLRQKMSQKQKKRVPVGVISIFHMLQV